MVSHAVVDDLGATNTRDITQIRIEKVFLIWDIVVKMTVLIRKTPFFDKKKSKRDRQIQITECLGPTLEEN